MRVRWIAMTTMAVLLLACTHYDNKDYASMNKIPMRTVCVGRMLTNLPKGNPLSWQQHFDYAKVSRLPGAVNDIEAFRALVEKKRTALAAEKHDSEPSLLSGYRNVGSNAAMLLHRQSASDVYGYDLDRYLWLGNWGYWLESQALLENSERDQFSTFDKVLAKLKPVNNFESLTSPGFCIDSALVTGDVGPIWSGVSAKIKEWPGVWISAGAIEDDGSRVKRPWEKNRPQLHVPTAFEDLEMQESYAKESMRSDDDARVVAYKILRKRDRTVAGMAGEEAAIKFKLANGQQYYRFGWNSVSDASRLKNSGFNFGLEAGKDQFTANYKPPPSAEELLALWDAVLESLKPRPTAG